MHVPVLIIGGGPTGLSCSILLSRLGVPSLLVERHATTSIFPKATGISTRSMELFRQWGLEERIRSYSLDLAVQNSVSNTLSEPELERRSLGFPTAFDLQELSPTYPAVCPQDYLEPVLLKYARRFGVGEVRFNDELVQLEQHADGVSATIRTRGTGRTTLIDARYVIAADGASSPTRQFAGIGMTGAGPARDFLTILFRADLTELVKTRRCALYTVQHPEITGVIVPTSEDNRWVLGMPCNLQANPDATRDINGLISKIRTATGVADLVVEVVSASTFAIAAQVAERFRERAVFLAGDAAHRMTPSGGMGMNTAIQDAHNLAWKIAAVHHGWAGAELLDSYEAERRPVAERNVSKSVGAHRDISGIAIDLGPVYHSAAVYAEKNASEALVEEPSAMVRAGRRAPHVWITRAGRQVSLLELFNTKMVMISGPDGAAWCRSAERISASLGIPFATMSFDTTTVGPEAAELWQRHFGLGLDGAVLVRPDGHVAWCANDASENTVPIISAVLARTLSMNDYTEWWLKPTVVLRAINQTRRMA